MKSADEELIRDRIQHLWTNTDFSATLFESLVAYAIMAADFDGNIMAYNEGARQIYGYTPEEMVGQQKIEALFPPDFLEAGYFQQAIDVLLATGWFSYEGEKVRKSGERFPAQILLALTKDQTGKVVGFVEIVQDLTEHKRAEEELRNHRDHLEVLVAKRTTELANANEALQAEITERKRVEVELRKQAQELAEADQRKNEFLAMLAHELRNPLAPVLSAVHVMRLSGTVGPTAQQAGEVVERQIRRMSRIVDDLLDVSRITNGKVQLRKEVMTLAAAVAGAVETVRPFVQSRRHELSVSLPPEPVCLAGDQTRLEQVLANLLHNAAKYTEPGGSIWLTAERDQDDIVVRVRDNGIGIAPDMLPRIFDLFAQADCSLDRSQGGLGIGLTLVRTLVEMHGGSVHVSTTCAGQGSEFVVRLPALPQVGVVDTPNQEVPVVTRSPRRVLVVDDNVDTAETIALVLKLAGHEVQAVHDGPTAIEAALTFQPEVVLLDIGLPKMDGYQVAKCLRQQAAPPKLLVALTGYGEEKDRRRSREVGFDLHLVKPVSPERLIEVLARWG
jgi:PAS domain S-box-containing protein